MESSAEQEYRVVVYCASADGNDPAYREEATRLGQALARDGMGLIYGGATVGLMGAVADGALGEGGSVVGFLPRVLVSREIAHQGLTRLEYNETMHERKAAMLELADAVIALPGGFGTLDELMEALTWAQLGIHNKPCVLINTLGYYDGLLGFLETAVAVGFLKRENYKRLQVAEDTSEAVALLRLHRESLMGSK
jgi:uncharacterized protein (TIGR00730 family)